MVKPNVLLSLLSSGGDTPKQKPPPASTEDKSRQRVHGSDNLVMEMDSLETDATKQTIEGFMKILDEIEVRLESVVKLSLDSLEKEEKRLKVVEAREKEISSFDESISRRLTHLRLVVERQSDEAENKLGLLLHSSTQKLEDLTNEFQEKKEEARRIFESINEKLCELDKKEKDFDLKQRVETERWNEESEAREKELSSLEEAIKEKSAALERKKETFELKLKEEADKLREENELKRKDLEIKEKLLEKRLKEIELKQMEVEARSKQQRIIAKYKKRSNLKLEPRFRRLMSLIHRAKKRKSREANDVDGRKKVCTDKSSDEVPKLLTWSDTKFNDFSKSMSSFAVDQVWALYDTRDDMPRIYAQIREIFSSHLSLQVTLLEHVRTTMDEKSLLSACGRFEYGETEIKSYLMFAHEMHHITCDKDVIVNPRKGETWALFRDWNTSWNSHQDLHDEPPYIYDYVEVISEFDDLQGIAVAYLGRVEGFVSVFNHAEQHGLIRFMISPGEMHRFSHKVESVELSGDENEGIPAGSFELNPAATPSYYPELEGAMVVKIQSVDCGIAPIVVFQDGSTRYQPIIVD